MTTSLLLFGLLFSLSCFKTYQIYFKIYNSSNGYIYNLSRVLWSESVNLWILVFVSILCIFFYIYGIHKNCVSVYVVPKWFSLVQDTDGGRKGGVLFSVTHADHTHTNRRTYSEHITAAQVTIYRYTTQRSNEWLLLQLVYVLEFFMLYVCSVYIQR